LAAPLMIGCDIRNMDSETKRILTNPEAIAVDQDALGIQGHRAARTGSTDVWCKPLANGATAVALLNRDDNPLAITALWKDFGFNDNATLTVRDLWQHKDLGTYTGNLTLTVAPHATVLLKLVPLIDQTKN